MSKLISLIVFGVLGVLCLQPVLASAAETKAVEDKKPPVVNVRSSLTPSDGSMINNNKPSISAEYLDDGIGVNPEQTRLFVDGQDVTSAAQVSQNKIVFVPSSPLSDGGHKVKLDVVDKAGNITTVIWSFTMHTQPPKVKITSHKPNQYVSRSSVLVAGAIGDSRVRVLVNGIIATIEKEVFSARVSLLEGSNTVTAVATDAFGNTGTDSVTVIVDSRPPVVNITAPAPNSLVRAASVIVTGTVDKNPVSVTVSAGNGSQPMPAEVVSGGFTAKDIKLKEGVNTITVTAVSQAGNTGTAMVKVTVDSVPPKIAITSPKDMIVTNKKMSTVTGTVDDHTAAVRINNTPVQVTKGMFTLSSVNLSEGKNAIMAAAVDRAGNQAVPAVVNVILDTTPPVSPALNALPPVTRLSPITVTGTSEPGAQIELFVNGTSKGIVKTDEKGSFSLKVNLSEGNNAITAVAYDDPGNASAPSAVLNVFLDTRPPKIL